MIKKPDIFSLIVCCLTLIAFIFFDDWMTRDILDQSLTLKNRTWDLIMYSITQNSIGYWVVRIMVLLISIRFGYDFIDGIRKNKLNKNN